MKLNEKKQIIKMLSNEWDLGKKLSGGKKDVCAWIYFCEIMSQSEKIIIEKKDDKIIGICGYTKYSSKKYLLRKYFYRLVKNILINSCLIENKDGMLKYLNNYDYTPLELKDYFDGEISILIVDSYYRGNGIGKKMILEIFDYARKDKINKLLILSDESCNYKFYENVGCKKIFEKKILNYEPDKCNVCFSEIGYIYEKILN